MMVHQRKIQRKCVDLESNIFNTAMIQKLSVSEIEDDGEEVKSIQETIKGIAEAIQSFLKI